MNAGKALDYVVKNYFIKSAGSRIEDGVPQHLVVILGDQSQDDVNRPANVISSTSIQPLGVGARNVDRNQLQVITNDPGRVLVVQDFTGLPTLERKVQNILEELTVPTTEGPVYPGPGKTAMSPAGFSQYNTDRVLQCVNGSVTLFDPQQFSCIALKNTLREILWSIGKHRT